MAQTPPAQRYPILQGMEPGATQVPFPSQLPAAMLERLSGEQVADPHDSPPWVRQAEPSDLHRAVLPQAVSEQPVAQHTLVALIPSPIQWPFPQSLSAAQTCPSTFLQTAATHMYPVAHPVLEPEHGGAHELPTQA
jgi:hypothetical protein